MKKEWRVLHPERLYCDVVSTTYSRSLKLSAIRDNTGESRMSEKRDERSFRIALRSARCPKCKGKMLEIQRPKVVCSQCEARYILAVQTGTFLVRSKLIEDTIPPPQIQQVKEVKETITKEVVLIPCEYCKGLMPQTAIFCPNCGARRKS